MLAVNLITGNSVARPGTFQPGVSGNPGGKSKKAEELRAQCRAAADKGVSLIMRDMLKTKDPKHRLMCWEALSNRGYGKPIQEIQATVSIFDQLGESDRTLALAALEAIAAGSEAAGERTSTTH